jgi:hypothetical protein
MGGNVGEFCSRCNGAPAVLITVSLIWGLGHRQVRCDYVKPGLDATLSVRPSVIAGLRPDSLLVAGGPAVDRLRGRSVVFVAEVNDAKAVAIGVCEDHKIRVVRVAVPVHSLSSDGHEALRLRRLLRRIGHVKVQV